MECHLFVFVVKALQIEMLLTLRQALNVNIIDNLLHFIKMHVNTKMR